MKCIAVLMIVLVSTTVLAEDAGLEICLKKSKDYIDNTDHTNKTLQAEVVQICSMVAFGFVEAWDFVRAKKAADAIDNYNMSSFERNLYIVSKAATACVLVDSKACSVAALSLDIVISGLRGNKEAVIARENLINIRGYLLVNGCNNGDNYSCYIVLEHGAYKQEKLTK